MASLGFLAVWWTQVQEISLFVASLLLKGCLKKQEAEAAGPELGN